MVNIYPLYENPDDIYNKAPDDEKGGKKAEAHLYKLLKEQLPDDWYVFYDRSFTGEVQENQIDFLVIVPGRGISNARELVTRCQMEVEYSLIRS